MGICSNCGFIGDTHLHHIVPRSKGGSDSPKNLIEVCHPCHRKIHNSEFGGENGLIKSGIKNKKESERLAKDFLDANSKAIEKFLFDFSVRHETNILADMLFYGVMSMCDIRNILTNSNKKKSFGDIGNMMKEMHDENIDEYSFIF